MCRYREIFSRTASASSAACRIHVQILFGIDHGLPVYLIYLAYMFYYRLRTQDSGLRTQDSGLSRLSENINNIFCHCERSEAISLINNQLVRLPQGFQPFAMTFSVRLSGILASSSAFDTIKLIFIQLLSTAGSRQRIKMENLHSLFDIPCSIFVFSLPFTHNSNHSTKSNQSSFRITFRTMIFIFVIPQSAPLEKFNQFTIYFWAGLDELDENLNSLNSFR